MKVILGLGNPGREYERTRHNVGWWLIDALADVWRIDAWRNDGNARVAAGRFGNANVRLIKPLTYMNLSGAVLKPLLRRPTWSPTTDLLVVVDDVALPIGRYRLRAHGSHGGHNGLRNIEQALGSRDYARLRIGVHPAEPERRIADLSDFVLSAFGKHERETVLDLLPNLTDASAIWVRDGIDKAMNVHN
ncbi:MAG: aminoacyl-tRNA hydrolase [Anaerolineae bacterium]|nr:aminoacyl-tRNA hydrolase [Gemmatimonadaceae bacterium]